MTDTKKQTTSKTLSHIAYHVRNREGSAGIVADFSGAHESKERLDLADDLAAGAIGIEYLVEEAEEGSANRVDLLTAIGTLVGLN